MQYGLKQQIKKTFQGLLLPFFLLCSISLCAYESEIKIVTEEWAPYNYAENRILKGFSVEIVQHIIQDLNVNATIEIYPSMRATMLLDIGPRTMLITMFRTPEREGKYNWIGPISNGAIYFYKKKGNPLVISSLEDAKKVGTIATRQDGLVFRKLTAAGFTNLDSTSVNGISIYQKLLMDRCDLGISDAPLGVKHILRKLKVPLDSLVQTSVRVIDSEMYIACNKAIPVNEINQWQKSLDKLKKSGVYNQLYYKYYN